MSFGILYRTCCVALALCATTSGRLDAGYLTTTYQYNNGQAGNMFDVVVGSNSLNVTGFDLHLDPGTWDLELYVKSGTIIGSEADPSAWTLVDSVKSVVSNGDWNATYVNFADFALNASAVSGIYITATNGIQNGVYKGLNYTDGENGAKVGDVFASNADLQILIGRGVAYPYIMTFQPRIWNGTIYYGPVTETQLTTSTPEPASLAIWGLGSLGMGLIVRRRRRQAALAAA
jgi:hypothetical protein